MCVCVPVFMHPWMCLCAWLSPSLNAHPPDHACRMLGSSGSGWVISRRLPSSWPCFLCSAPSRPLGCITSWRPTTAGNPSWLLSSLCFYILFEGNQIYPAVKILAEPAHGWCGQQSQVARTLRVKWYTATQVWFTNIYRYIICLYEYLFIQNLSSLYNVELWRRLLVPV